MKTTRRLLFVAMLAGLVAWLGAGCDSGDDDDDSGTPVTTNGIPVDVRVDGTWVGNQSVGGGPPENLLISLSQTGSALSGRVNGASLTGSVNGDNLEFTATTGAASPATRTVWTYKGAVNAGRTYMEGTFTGENTVMGTQSGVWRASK